MHLWAMPLLLQLLVNERTNTQTNKQTKKISSSSLLFLDFLHIIFTNFVKKIIFDAIHNTTIQDFSLLPKEFEMQLFFTSENLLLVPLFWKRCAFKSHGQKILNVSILPIMEHAVWNIWDMIHACNSLVNQWSYNRLLWLISVNLNDLLILPFPDSIIYSSSNKLYTWWVFQVFSTPFNESEIWFKWSKFFPTHFLLFI